MMADVKLQSVLRWARFIGNDNEQAGLATYTDAALG